MPYDPDLDEDALDDDELPPFAQVDDDERAMLTDVCWHTPETRELVARATDAEIDEADTIARLVIESLVDWACDMSPVGPFGILPISIDVVLLRLAVLGAIDPTSALYAVDVACAAATQLPLLAREHLTIPDQLDGWELPDERDLPVFDTQMRDLTVVRLMAAGAATVELLELLDAAGDERAG